MASQKRTFFAVEFTNLSSSGQSLKEFPIALLT